MFEEKHILKNKKPFKEMSKDSIDSYLSKKRNKLIKFVHLIGELFKVGVLRFIIIQHIITSLM